MIGKIKAFILCIGAFAGIGVFAAADVMVVTNQSEDAPASERVINSAYYDFYIPPSDDLPAGSIVKVKSISFSGFNDSYQTSKNEDEDVWADSAFVRLNGVRSDPVNGGSVSSSQYSGGTWSKKIASGEGVQGTLLKYAFSSDCLIVVGKRYPGSSSGNVGDVGNGITLLHANGKANGRGGNNFVSATAVRFIKTDDANSIVSFSGSKNDGLYPVYSIEYELAELSAYWTGKGSDNKMSNPANWSTGEVPVSRNISIDSGDGTLAIEVDCELNCESLLVSGNGSITFTDSENGGRFNVANMLVGAPVILNCSSFYPSSIEFVNSGSISIGEQGRLTDVVFSYTGSLPNIGSAFTPTSIDSDVVNPERWGGVIWLRDVSVSDFNPNVYGHGGTESLPASTVRLSGVRGHFPRQLTVNPVVELKNDGYSYGMNVIDGYSRDANHANYLIVIEKLKGDGAFWTDGNAPTVLVNFKNFDEYSGAIQLPNKIVVLGPTVPEVTEHNRAGSIYIGTNVVATIPNNVQWRADGGIYVKGTLNVSDAVNDRIRSGTQVVTYDTGVVKLTAVSGARWDFDYSRIQGSGTLCFAGTSWCSLTTNGTISTSLILKNEQPGGLVVPPYTLLADGEKNYVCEIGSLSGSGAIRGDYNWVSGEDAIRSLRIKQSADTVWTGIVGAGYERIGEISVATGESRAGTLTLAGEAQNAVPLTVEEGAKVRITGAWKGSVDVNGAIGGTGKVEGTVSFADGSSLVVSSAEDLEDPLEVSSATFAGTVTIELPEGSTGGKVLKVAGSVENSAQFVVKTGGNVRAGITASIKSEAGGGSVVRVNLKRFVIRIR